MNAKNLWEAMKELSDKQFKVYMAVYKLADNDVGYCFAGNEHIGEKINKSESRVSQTINELIQLGFLNVLKINQGFKVIERRLYTADCYKNYLKDSKLKIIKTTYKKYADKDGIENVIYFNEKNVKNNTVADIGNGTLAKIGNGTVADIGNLTSTNIKVSKINKLKPKKPELVPFENFFKEELKMNFTATNQKAVEKLLKTMNEQQVKKFLLDNYKMAIAAKEKNPNIKSINGLFVDYLKKGNRINASTTKEIKTSNSSNEKISSDTNTIVEDLKKEVVIINSSKEVILTPEDEEKALQILVKEGHNRNFLETMKRKSIGTYYKTLSSILKQAI